MGRKEDTMKKIVVLLVILALLAPSISFAGGHRNFHDGFHQGLGALAAVAVVGAVANMLTPRTVYAEPAVARYDHPCSPRYESASDPYEEAYQREAARIQRQRQIEWERMERERGREAAQRDYGYYR